MKKIATLKMQTTESQSSEKSAENTDKQHSSEELVQKVQIGNTPFMGIKQEENYFLVLGKYKIAEGFNDFSEMHDYIEKNKWQCIGVLTQAIIEQNKK